MLPEVLSETNIAVALSRQLGTVTVTAVAVHESLTAGLVKHQPSGPEPIKPAVIACCQAARVCATVSGPTSSLTQQRAVIKV
jgi:hypothetical protein